MANHWDTTAPRAGRVDQRQGHIIARIFGTLALAGFMLALATGTARAGVLGEIVEEVAEPVVQPVEDIVEPVVHVVEQPVSEVVSTVQPVVGSVEQPVGEVVGAVQPVVGSDEEPVGEVVQPVVSIVEGSVSQVAEQVAPVIAGVQQPLARVIDPTLDLIENSAGSVSGLVDDVTAQVLDRVNAVVNVPELLSGPLELISMTEDLIVDLVDTIDRTGEPGSDPARPINPGTTADGRETTATGPPGAGHATDDVVPLPVPAEVPGLPGESTIQIDGTRPPGSERSSASTPTADPLVIVAHPADDVDEDLSAQTRPLRGASTTPSSSNSGPATGLMAVLVLLGLIAPRLSRWLRPRPVHWRPITLAEALELPG